MNSFFKKLFKNYNYWLILAFLSICFFIGTSSFNYLTQKNNFIKWGSPDENANYVFTKLYAQEGELAFFEKYNLYSGEIMHPRSVRSDAGWLKPVSFLGIILIYGKIASIFGCKIIPYLTPLFAAIGIIYYYLLIRKIFSKTNALISACLLASLPPYIYYSARSMFHNVLFVVLLVIGFYYLIDSRGDSRGLTSGTRSQTSASHHSRFYYLLSTIRYLKNPALAGVFIGLAIIARTSELLWLAPMLFALWIFNLRKFGLTKLLIFLSFLALAILPALYWNRILFGSFWKSGYPEMNQSIANIASASSGIVNYAAGKVQARGELWAKIKNSIFYFGIHPRYSLRMFDYYFVKMFYWIFWPAVAGLAIFFLGPVKNFFQLLALIANKYLYRPGDSEASEFAAFSNGEARPRLGGGKIWKYIISCSIMSAILLFYYGSWEFHDNPNPNQYTIGNSYTRYWLPIYFAAIPFAALAIETVARPFRRLFFAPLQIPDAGQFRLGEILSRRPFCGEAQPRLDGDCVAAESSNSPRSSLLQGAAMQKNGQRKFFSLAVRQDLIAACIRTILIFIVFFISLQFVLFGSDEGLIYAFQKNRPSRNEYDKILALTESNSVIITRYHDKLFFPERKVIVGLFDDGNMIREYANLAKYIPVYYYNFTLPPGDIAYLNSRRLAAFGLRIEKVEQVNGDFSLYKLLPVNGR